MEARRLHRRNEHISRQPHSPLVALIGDSGGVDRPVEQLDQAATGEAGAFEHVLALLLGWVSARTLP